MSGFMGSVHIMQGSFDTAKLQLSFPVSFSNISRFQNASAGTQEVKGGYLGKSLQNLLKIHANKCIITI